MFKRVYIIALLAGISSLSMNGSAFAQAAEQKLSANLAQHKYMKCEEDNVALLKQLTQKIRLIEIERQNLAQKPKLLNHQEVGSRLTHEQGRRLRFLETKVGTIQDENKKLKEKLLNKRSAVKN